MRKIFFFILICASCTQPNKEEDEINANKVIESVKSMSKLGTTEYTLRKVVAGEDNQWYSIGSRRIMMMCKAHVVAGIDASQIQFTDVNTKEKKIKLTIPPVELITFNIPANEFKFVDEEVGFLRGGFTSKEINTYQRHAEKMIKKQVEELNITAEAEKNAILFLDKILRSSGFVSIEIKTTPSKSLL